MSRSSPRGRLKVVSVRLLNTPATLGNRGGWFCFDHHQSSDENTANLPGICFSCPPRSQRIHTASRIGNSHCRFCCRCLRSAGGFGSGFWNRRSSDPSLAGETHWTGVKLCGWLLEEKRIALSYRTPVRYLHEHHDVRKIPRPNARASRP